MTNLSHVAEVTSPVFAAVAAYASYLSAMNGRRAKQEQHDPVLAGSPLQTTERDPNGCAPTRLEIVNVGGPAFESAFALQAGANACSNTLGSGFLRTNQEACVRTDMSPEGQFGLCWHAGAQITRVMYAITAIGEGSIPAPSMLPYQTSSDSGLTSLKTIWASTRESPVQSTSGCRPKTLPEDTCAPRIAALVEQTKSTRSQPSGLAALADSEPIERISTTDRAALDSGGPMRVKTILQELTEEGHVDGRDAIEPTFLIPAVRPPSGSMGETARRANQVLMAPPPVGVG